MTWPGGSVAIERFNIVPNGTEPREAGEPAGDGLVVESLRKRARVLLEWQGGQLFMAGTCTTTRAIPSGTSARIRLTNAQNFRAPGHSTGMDRR
jgi:hypothetical protein